MPEWPKGADCKSVVRGFESLSVLQLAGLVELADTGALSPPVNSYEFESRTRHQLISLFFTFWKAD